MAQSMYDLTLEEQELALAERRELLKQRARMAAQQIGVYKSPEGPTQAPGFVSAVTGQGVMGPTVKRSLLAQMAPMIAEGRDAYESTQLAKDIGQQREREQADALAQLEAMPRATPATPATPATYGAGDEGPTMTPGMPATPATKPSLRDTILWAQRAQANPSLKGIAGQLISDQIVREPERQEARAERQLTREERALEAQRNRVARAEEKREQRDWQAEQNEQNRGLRATIAAAVRSSRGGDGGGSTWSRSGVKAADIQKDVDAQGNITLTDKLSGEQKFFKGGGKPSATTEKTAADEATKTKNAREGLVLLRQMEPLLSTATSSRLGAARDAAGSVVGYSTKAGDAAGELSNMGANLVSLIDRSGLGPQFSDADLKFLANKAGGLGDPTIPESRKRAVYARVLDQFKRHAGEPTREASGTVGDPVPGSDKLRQPSRSVDDLVKKYGG